ncbi:hypothetical protein KAFR_0F04010 [Kazachstania africana CBS 2517]|uniref:EF-hand domain-containing protein n=1 Tax=Kazachstania africana (strain ATCC 22294 / BCRC 22015 / CBS 2517 / CECT 1963 / NBRC 1671 / NRRL Y-8276) TaxID=1071382 RepID=H2AX96_KAZAF|nr:hypothetical protein KAFR_0F04010 [Kazachstania africana CBS 2517]CCF58996.1 hypothetical protein KAFR_0F04010 [Kazachstania africana CBS 2517]
MCARKVKYAAGDDLMLYATPKEAMEATKRAELEEKMKRNQQKVASKSQGDGRMNTRVTSAPPVVSSANYQNSMASSPAQYQHYSQLQEAGWANQGKQRPVPPSSLHRNQMSPTVANPTSGHHSVGTPYVHNMNSSSHILNKSQANALNSPQFQPFPPPSRNCNNRGMGTPSPPRNMPVNNADLEEQRNIRIATQLFHRHDVRKRERLTAEELQNLLQNDDQSSFCISSIDSLINLFGASRFGTLNLAEFISMYNRIKLWRKIYVDNDINGSMTISVNEYHNSLQELAYRIPFAVTEKLFDQYAQFINPAVNSKELKFDRFVESLVWLMRLTKSFRNFDSQESGIATIPYKDFIETSLYLGRFLPH